MNAIRLIKDREATYTGTNATRFYNFVTPLASGECRIDTYAVKTRNKRTHELAIKKVMRMRTDKARYYVRDILINNFTNGYVANWCNEPFGKKHQAVWEDVDAYIGEWGYADYRYGKVIDLHGVWLNDFSGTKYEHCGFTDNAYIKFRDYAEVWKQNHATELLARSNLYRIITPSFVHALATDKGLFAFFRSHIGEIRQCGMSGRAYAAYGVREILYAYKNGVSLTEAHEIVSFTNETRHMRFTPFDAVDKTKLRKHLARRKVSTYEYDWYCRELSRLNIDIRAYGYMYPSASTMRKVERDYHALLDAEHAEELRKRKREEARERRERKERLARWKRICGYLDTMDGREIGGYEIVVPKSASDLIAEGNAMRNCVGTYGEKFAEGQTILVFFHKQGKPCMDVEIDPLDFKVVQARLFANANASREDKRIAADVASEIETHYRKAA